MPAKRTPRRERGAAVILALAILALLAVFAISMLSIMRLERSASANYVASARARLIADAGIERSGAELLDRFGRGSVADPAEHWVVDHGHLEKPLPPITQDPPVVSLLGSLGATLAHGRDEYRVRVADSAARLPINDAPAATLAPVLDALGLAMKKRLGHDPIGGRGAAILALRDGRPGRRFSSFADLELALGPAPSGVGLGTDDAALVARFCSIAAWVDPTAVEPSVPDGQDIFALDPPVRLEVSPRAPVNVNLAPAEVIAAIVAPVGGRAARVRPASSPTLQPIDEQDPRARWTSFQEEVQYSTASDVVSVGPIGGDAAWELASALVTERERRHGFKSLPELEAWIDAWDAANPQTLASTPASGTTGAAAAPDFRAYASRVARDAIKAALDPNARSVEADPDEPSALLVDRQDLLVVDASGRTRSAVTLDACVGPTGYFELQSVGRIVDQDGIEVARVERDVTVRLFSTVRLTSQSDLEADGATLTGAVGWPEARAIRDSASDSDAFRPYAQRRRDPFEGRIALAPCGRDRSPTGVFLGHPSFAAYLDDPRGASRAALQADVAASSPDAMGGAARLIDQTPLLRDGGPLCADGLVARAPRPNASLLYRAASTATGDPTDPSNPGRGLASSPRGGNVDMTRGGVELWYKPDFDWARTDGSPEPIFCGLGYVSHCLASGRSGTQMLVFRNTDGDIRVVRLYYELVGVPPDQDTLVRDPMRGDRITVREYVARANQSIHCIGVSKVDDGQLSASFKEEYGQAYQFSAGSSTPGQNRSDGQTGASQTTPEQDSYTTAKIVVSELDQFQYVYTYERGWGYPWPPAEISLQSRIKYARRETAVPFDRLKSIGRGEWHHLAIAFDDSDGGPDGLQVYVDGKMLSTTPHTVPGSPNESEFCELNQPPGVPADEFVAGAIERVQQVEGKGVIKFRKLVREMAHGTVDDILSFPWPTGTPPAPPERYPDEGVYRTSVLLPVGPGASLLSLEWTAALPSRYGRVGTAPEVAAPTPGSGTVQVTARSMGRSLGSAVQSSAGVGLGTGAPDPSREPAVPLAGVLLNAPLGTTSAGLDIEVRLRAATFGSDGLSVASPALDDLTLRYRGGPPTVVAVEEDPD